MTRLGCEEALQRRQGVARVPVGVARPHHVAAGRIDVEGRVEGDAALELALQIGAPFRPARLDDLVGEPGDLGEPPLLVEHVVVVGIGGQPPVAQQGFEMAVEMGDGAEPHRAGAVGIDLGDAALAEMGDRAEPQPPRLLDRRAGDRRRHVVEELDAVIALAAAQRTQARACSGVRDGAAAPGVAEHHIGEQPRRDDRVGARCARGRRATCCRARNRARRRAPW